MGTQRIIFMYISTINYIRYNRLCAASAVLFSTSFYSFNSTYKQIGFKHSLSVAKRKEEPFISIGLLLILMMCNFFHRFIFNFFLKDIRKNIVYISSVWNIRDAHTPIQFTHSFHWFTGIVLVHQFDLVFCTYAIRYRILCALIFLNI